MPVTYAPVPLEATAGTAFAAGLQLYTLVDATDQYELLDLIDYTEFTFTCGPVTLTEEDDEGLPGLTVGVEEDGEIDVRMSAAQTSSFTMKDGLAYTAFEWSLTAIYDGDADPTEIGSGELRVSA